MKISDHCKRPVVAIRGDADIADAAKLMREQHVGFLVVFNQSDKSRKPVGVLTDRDIVLQVTAREVDPHAVRIEDAMTRNPLVATEADDLAEVLQAMQMMGIRRVPVTDTLGVLTGVFAVDDAVGMIAELLCNVSGSIKSEQRQEWRARSSRC